MMKLGIDYGTTTTLISVCRTVGRDASAELINIGGKRSGYLRSSIPSVIALTQAAELLIGYDAEEIARTRPKEAVLLRSLKRCLSCERKDGEQSDDCWNALNYRYCLGNQRLKVFNKTFSVRDLIVEFLRKVLELPMVKLIYGDDELDTIGISIPALFKSSPRRTLYDLMLQVVPDNRNIDVINEPTAAIIACQANLKNEEPGIYAICDVGGGTTDIVLFEKKEEDSSYFLFKPSGIKIAGDDVDSVLLDKLYSCRSGFTPDQALAEVRRAKELLTVSPSATVFGQRLSREDFEGIVAPVLEKIVEALRNEVKVVYDHYKPTSVTGRPFFLKKIYLSGGGSRIPLLKKLLNSNEYINNITDFEPDINFIKNDVLYRIYANDLPIVVVAIGTSMPRGEIEDVIQHMLPFAIYSVIGDEKREEVPMYADLPVEFLIQIPGRNNKSVKLVARDPRTPKNKSYDLNDLVCNERARPISLGEFIKGSHSFRVKINENNIMWVTLSNSHRRSFSLPWQGGIESAIFEKYRAKWRREHLGV